MRTTRVYVRDCSPVSAYALVWFCGDLQSLGAAPAAAALAAATPPAAAAPSPPTKGTKGKHRGGGGKRLAGGAGPPPAPDPTLVVNLELAVYIVSRRGLHSISASFTYDGGHSGGGEPRACGLHSISARFT